MMADMATIVRRAIESAYKRARTGQSVRDLVMAEVEQQLRRNRVDGRTQREMMDEARRVARTELSARDERERAAFNARHGTTANDQARLANETRAIAARAATADRTASRDILRIVATTMERTHGRDDDVDWRRVARRAAQRVGAREQYVRTEVETAKAAMDRAARLTQATAAGYETFTYGGPGGNLRVFCKKHLGKTYTLREIRAMNNGQGLSVEHYCGGYNCRHRWIPFVDTREADRTALAASIDREMPDDWGSGGGAVGLQGRDLADAFDVRLPGVRTTIESVASSHGVDSVVLDVRTHDGKNVGYLHRTFSVDGNGERIVDHELFQLKGDYQGRGAAATVMANSFEMYERAGVDRVRVHAALDGGHVVWAKLGFQFDDEAAGYHQRTLWAMRFADHIMRTTGATLDEAMAAVGGLHQPHDFVTYRASIRNIEVSGYEWKRQTPNLHWYGQMRVRGPERALLNDYLSRSKK